MDGGSTSAVHPVDGATAADQFASINRRRTVGLWSVYTTIKDAETKEKKDIIIIGERRMERKKNRNNGFVRATSRPKRVTGDNTDVPTRWSGRIL